MTEKELFHTDYERKLSTRKGATDPEGNIERRVAKKGGNTSVGNHDK